MNATLSQSSKRPASHFDAERIGIWAFASAFSALAWIAAVLVMSPHSQLARLTSPSFGYDPHPAAESIGLVDTTDDPFRSASPSAQPVGEGQPVLPLPQLSHRSL